ncbi:MAG: hypothetical protein HY815_11520 [Candidatus Riflebacteria bacterium]|nr:hypothetical protein [Candidatus Riflebacteria bacterium]
MPDGLAESPGMPALDVSAIVGVQLLKDPLRCIENLSRFLSQYVTIALDPGQVDSLAQLVVAARELHEKLPRMLVDAPAPDGHVDEYVEIDLAGVLSRVSTDLEGLLQHRRVRVAPGPLPRVRGHPVLLRVLCENLVAVSARREGRVSREITIEARPCELGASGRVGISVVDGGPWGTLVDGPPPDRQATGSGSRRDEVVALCFLLVRTVVARHGGSLEAGVTCEGRPCLSFTLPAVSALCARCSEEATGDRSATGKVPVALTDDCLASIGHDLRSPASTILSSAMLILDRSNGQLRPEHQMALTRIHRNASFMLELLDDVLDTLRLDSGNLTLHRQPHQLGPLLKAVVEEAQPVAAAKSIRLRLGLPEAPLVVWVDRSKLIQIAQNLISNAIKFTRPSSEVAVEATLEPDGLELRVKDHGLGIPESELDKLFKKFSQTSARATAGERCTGLGLYITRRLVELHGGTISVTSTPGEGSTFTVRLPMGP